jgi:NADH-quinone oxidoreductase subunit N
MIPSIYLEVTVLLTGVLLLLFEAFSNQQSKNGIAWGGIAGLGLALVLSFFVDTSIPAGAPYARFYIADPMAIFFKRFALVTAILVLVMAVEFKGVLRNFIFSSKGEAGVGEFYCLPVFTCAGLMWMASAVDFIMIFVSLELVTISFYVLVSYMRRSHGSLEAGVKYLILGALSTGFLVYGITWIFGVTGQTNLALITAKAQGLSNVSVPMLFGVALVLVALGFKIAAVPFQLWVPDVYQGAPTPITAYLSVGSKAAGFVILIRVLLAFTQVDFLQPKLAAILTVLAGLTLVYGNLAAIPQDNLKRLLGYSSIAHAGYLLVGVASLKSSSAQSSIIFYLAGYLVMTLLSFLVMIVVANHSAGDDISHFRGLSKRSPLMAFGMLVAMSSLAGIPLTAGFLGKFLVFFAAIDQQHYVLAIIGLVTVAAGFYYYLKVVRAMYWMEPDITTPVTASALTKLAVVVLVILTFVLGVYPQPVFKMISPDAKAQYETAKL